MKRKEWVDTSQMDGKSQMSKFSKFSKAWTVANQSMSGFSTLNGSNLNVKFLNNAQQNHQEQLEKQKEFEEAMKSKKL